MLQGMLIDRAAFSSRAYKNHVRDDMAERHALEHTIDGTLAPSTTSLDPPGAELGDLVGRPAYGCCQSTLMQLVQLLVPVGGCR